MANRATNQLKFIHLHFYDEGKKGFFLNSRDTFSEHTIRAYNYALDTFEQYLAIHCADHIDSEGSLVEMPDGKPIAKAYKIVLGFNAWNRKRGCTPHTVAFLARHVKVYFRHLDIVGELEPEFNPYAGPKQVSLPKTPKLDLADDLYDSWEYTALWRYLGLPKYRNERHSLLCSRDQLYLTLLYETGIRSGELATLVRGQIDLDKRVISHLQKGGDHQLTCFPEKLVTHFEQHFAIMDMFELQGSNAPLFPSCDTKGFPKSQRDKTGSSVYTHQPITRDGMAQRFHSTCERMAKDEHYLATDWNPVAWRGLHIWRHTWASRLILAGVPIKVVSKQLGHKNPGTTHAFYAHIKTSDRQAAFKELADW